jgi:hypothetical protein
MISKFIGLCALGFFVTMTANAATGVNTATAAPATSAATSANTAGKPVAAPAGAVAGASVTVTCPAKGGVKTYGDAVWTGIDHDTYPLASNRVDGIPLCTYAGPQGFNFDLSPSGVAYKNCKVTGKGTFSCSK